MQSYQNFISQGIFRRDERQRVAMLEVQRVYDDLVAFKNGPHANTRRDVEMAPPNRLGIVPTHFLKKSMQKEIDRAAGISDYHPLSDVKGLYMYGGVGCGKTALMDILYNEAPMEKKMRVHFHQFMLDVHSTVHSIRKHKRTEEAVIDLFDEVAQRMASNAELLCFDELFVADIADAMIMKRLFHAFYKIGVCTVFTSNRVPEDLYKDGLNRESFLPFIRLLRDRCVIYNMDSSTDYRLSGTNAKTYLCPFTPENDAKFSEMIRTVTKGEMMQPAELRVFGRDVYIPLACNGICRFTFAELCGGELSVADYSVIAKTYHTIFLEHVPALGPDDSDVKRRFINLIDELYQHKVKLVVYAEVGQTLLETHVDRVGSIEGGGGGGAIAASRDAGFDTSLFRSGFNSVEGNFMMERTVSRLNEMNTQEYLESKHKGEEVGLDTY